MSVMLGITSVKLFPEDSMPTVLELYEKLKPKLGEEEAKALIEFVEASVERKAATKEDLQRTEMALREDLVGLKEDLRQTEAALREEIHRLDQKIEATKADLIKWAFGFWIGNVAVLAGIMFALLRAFAEK
ncbi:MAG: DUF1640 domain-containing protein [Candidatus Tectomicrobia bacterium]|uniref:DUF1640 domain-containing protein n=1 Tax=Tectimicrobiota bacterium TaxID=2528274 RepID=A0A932CQX3_UNCTE|nr:DUF1640 domain-containing protein [Candidatus Tectomicrobia bacterium]